MRGRFWLSVSNDVVVGTNAIKGRETLKENESDNLTLVNITDEEKYLPDLQGISDEAYFAESITEYIAKHSVEQIDYLVVEEYAGDIDYLLNEIKSLEGLVKRVFFKNTSAEWIIRRLDEAADIV